MHFDQSPDHQSRRVDTLDLTRVFLNDDRPSNRKSTPVKFMWYLCYGWGTAAAVESNMARFLSWCGHCLLSPVAALATPTYLGKAINLCLDS